MNNQPHIIEFLIGLVILVVLDMDLTHHTKYNEAGYIVHTVMAVWLLSF